MMKKNISKLILLVMSLVLVVGCTALKNSNENNNDKADVLSKIACHYRDFHCSMRFPKWSAHFPDMILSNKHMLHVKHIATNIGLGSLSFIRSAGIAAIACTLVLIFSGQTEIDVSHETCCRQYRWSRDICK